jgi:putative heme-binding domain-containing protein
MDGGRELRYTPFDALHAPSESHAMNGRAVAPLFSGLLASLVVLPASAWDQAENRARAEAVRSLFARDNLVAWCIVPFDAKKRGPEERVAMLKRLGIKRFAYDWRAEHLPTFDREVGLLKKEGIELTAVWFPANLGDEARQLLAVIEKHRLKPQLWVSMGGGGPARSAEEQRRKVEEHALALRPIAEAAAKLGCSVALYNHGSWFGEPENQLAILDALRLPNVGIVYNLHHGHDHLDRFPQILDRIKPHLLALNLNGMVKGGDRAGKKILPLGQGDEDLRLLQTIADSGWRGPVGILGHTEDDAEERLQDNLDGLAWLVPQLLGKPTGPKPTSRTLKKPPAAAPAPGAGWLADGKPEYRTPPLVVECVARLTGKEGYNILVACDTKQSAAHWELFTMPGSGLLTAYLPGRKPDHVRSRIDICDGKIHAVGMILDRDRVRLYVDGKEVASTPTQATGGKVVPGGLGFGRLAEGGLGCAGTLLRVRLTAGERRPAGPDDPLAADDHTIGTWRFGAAGTEAADLSKLKNPARPAARLDSKSVIPPPGPNLVPADSRLKATLIDRSAADAYLAVRADGTGRVFVGGREKLFVFEPDGKGGFLPRRELYRFPPDSILIGLEYRGDDLYVLACHGLYLIPGGRVKRDGLTPRRILWGVPLDYHISFHCLTWGPDGQLYLDHGDPLLNYGDWSRPDHWGCWTLFAGPDGTKVPYTGAGAVLKVRPNGEMPRVLARGLRGPVGLAFDRHWDLFTNDNDHESRADLYAPMRLLHVSPQADFAWPRGWMASKSPDRADLLDSIHPALGRGVPCDLAYCDEPTLPDLRGSLLLCRWDRSAVTRHTLTRKGSGFTADDQVFAQGSNQCRPTGIAVDASGRVFVTSLYLGGNVVTPHCPSDLVVIAPAGRWRPPFDETRASADELWAALDGPSWETRRRAHTELLRRGGEALAPAIERLGRVRDGEPAAAHLPWLAAAVGGRQATAALTRLAADRHRPESRLQSLRALAAFPALAAPVPVFTDALADASGPIRLAGLEGLLALGVSGPTVRVAELASGPDPTLRQAAATLLARTASVEDLDRLARSSEASARLASVLAAGIRLTVPPADAGPPRGVALHFPKGNAFFSPQLRFADRTDPVDLAPLGPVGSYTTAQRWAAGSHTPAEEHLFDLLAATLHDRDDRVKSQATFYLGWLRDVRTEAGVARVHREARTRGLLDRPPVVVKKAWQIGRLSDPAFGQTLERGPIDLTATFGTGREQRAWKMTAADSGTFPLPAGAGAVYVYFRLQSRDRQPALLSVPAGAVHIWHNGRAVAPEPDGAALLDLQPGSNDVLLRTTGAALREPTIRVRTGVSVELPEKADGATLAERLRGAKGTTAIPPGFLSFDWSVEGRKGDAARGRKLFGSLGCVRCHAITADQAGGGAPSLAEARKRFTSAHLVESILLPDRQVAEEFRATQVVLLDGRTLTGVVLRESATEIELLLSDTTRQTLKVSAVEERKRLTTSPMPAGLVRTPDELRDLLAYLLSDHHQPP